eukprot:GHRR01004638.1.p1 GENE.GHRR01004638.1~~GHRR01004638.1.p1  ORF type:complete len:307 (+),score=67.44 GHRR01004638.1:157-1077(+)
MLLRWRKAAAFDRLKLAQRPSINSPTNQLISTHTSDWGPVRVLHHASIAAPHSWRSKPEAATHLRYTKSVSLVGFSKYVTPPAAPSAPAKWYNAACHLQLVAATSTAAEPAYQGSTKQEHEQSDTIITISALTISAPAATTTAAATYAAASHPTQVTADRLGGCLGCSGTGRVTCKECEGRGFLRRGGYNKKNPLNMARIRGSKWTAMQETMGWRHFMVLQHRKLDRQVFVLMQASCDHSIQLWVNAQSLRKRSCWAAGWLPMSEVQGLGLELQGTQGLKCQSCAGLGYKVCKTCDGTGRKDLVVL